jgi:hypothetical protein
MASRFFLVRAECPLSLHVYVVKPECRGFSPVTHTGWLFAIRGYPRTARRATDNHRHRIRSVCLHAVLPLSAPHVPPRIYIHHRQARMTEASAWSRLSSFRRCAPSLRASRTSIVRHSPIFASSCVLPLQPHSHTPVDDLLFSSASFHLSQHPFPYFGTVTLPEFADAFIEIADQVTADHPTLGVHVWNLRGTLNRSLTIDRLHPTVHGHIALGEALAMRLRWLVTGP